MDSCVILLGASQDVRILRVSTLARSHGTIVGSLFRICGSILYSAQEHTTTQIRH